MGIICADAGSADQDVAATGQRISPNYVRRCICKFCGGAVDDHYCALRIFYADQRVFVAGVGEGSGRASVLGHNRTSSCSAEVRVCTAI